MGSNDVAVPPPAPTRRRPYRQLPRRHPPRGRDAQRRRREKGQRRRRPVRLLVLLGVALVLAGAVVFAVWRDVSRAREDLEGVRSSLEAARSAARLETADGRSELIRRLDHAERAVAATEGNLRRSRSLSLVGAVPGLRSQRSGLLQLVHDAGGATAAAHAVMSDFDRVAGEAVIRDGTVPLEALATLNEAARRGTAALAPLVRGSGGLWGPLGDARRRFDTVVGSTADRLRGGADALTASLTFLGRDGERRYFLAFQNNAEMRDQGMVLSYGVLHFAGGRFNLERTGSVAELALAGPGPTPVPPGTQAVFGSLAPTQTWQNVNLTADFAFSGAAMAAMYRQATGTPVDGVVAVDVVGLARLLEVIGPVRMPGLAEPVSAETAGRVLLHDQYLGIPPNADRATVERRERLADLARGVVDQLATGSRDPIRLGRTLADAAAGGHLRLWSADPREEALFDSAGLGGGPGLVSADRTFHLAVQNRTATKLDYFVKPVVSQRVRITEEGDAIVTTTVRLENRAPVGAQPSYQMGPDAFTKDPGDYVGWLLLWAPAGSEQPAATVESALLLSQHVLLVKAGQSKEFTFQETRIPDAVRDGRLVLRLVPQPRPEPVDLRITVIASGRWDVRGEPSWSGPWDRTHVLTWEIRD